MTDLEFLDQAEKVLQVVEACCDQLNDEAPVDIDNQRVGGMVTLTFANKSQIVVNLQKPLHELWLAARAGGYHYRWHDGLWLDSKSGQEFFANLTLRASEQAGVSLVFGG